MTPDKKGRPGIIFDIRIMMPVNKKKYLMKFFQRIIEISDDNSNFFFCFFEENVLKFRILHKNIDVFLITPNLSD